MAIMWDVPVRTAARRETPEEIVWRIKFARALVASGFEVAIVREALVPDDLTMQDCAVPGARLADAA